MLKSKFKYYIMISLSLITFCNVYGQTKRTSISNSKIIFDRLIYIYNNVTNSNADLYFSKIGYKYFWNDSDPNGKISFSYISTKNKNEFGFTRRADTTCETFFILYNNQEYINFLSYVKNKGFKYDSDIVKDEKVFIYLLKDNMEVTVSKFYSDKLQKQGFKIFFAITAN